MQWELLLAGIGGVVVLLSAVRVFSFLVAHFFRFPSLSRYGAGSGAWAVITGASDGIGKAFALELAKHKFNVLLISRTKSKLDALAETIRSTYGVKAETLDVDFSSHEDSLYDDIQESIKGKDVSVLVNNVGISYEYPMKFLDLPEEYDENIIKINITDLNKITRIALPGLLARGKGAVINLSSISGVIPAPLLASYSASKAYISTFTKCLSVEYAGSGVHFLSVTPSFVATNMSKMRKTTLLVCSPQVIAKGALASLGKELEYSPYLIHDLLIRVLQLLPSQFVLNYIGGINRNLNRAALRKREREQREKKE